MTSKPFDNVENQIGFCGIWCGSCPAGNGSIIELTRRYEEAVKKNRMEKWAPKDFDFREFMKGLNSLQKISLCRGCLQGGGNSTCTIRTCAKEKKVSSCSQCELLMNCKNFEILEKSHPTIKQELVKIKNTDRRQLIERWKIDLKDNFPNCIVVCDSS